MPFINVIVVRRLAHLFLNLYFLVCLFVCCFFLQIMNENEAAKITFFITNVMCCIIELHIVENSLFIFICIFIDPDTNNNYHLIVFHPFILGV